jgi:hypothetical protein
MRVWSNIITAQALVGLSKRELFSRYRHIVREMGVCMLQNNFGGTWKTVDAIIKQGGWKLQSRHPKDFSWVLEYPALTLPTSSLLQYYKNDMPAVILLAS